MDAVIVVAVVVGAARVVVVVVNGATVVEPAVVVGTRGATVEAVDGGGVVTGPEISVETVMHPAKTTTANAAAAATRNMLRPFTQQHDSRRSIAIRHHPDTIGNSPMISQAQHGPPAWLWGLGCERDYQTGWVVSVDRSVEVGPHESLGTEEVVGPVVVRSLRNGDAALLL